MEIVIWGKLAGSPHEMPLYTKAATESEAKLAAKKLVRDYGAHDIRLSIVDLCTPPDFINAII